MSFFVELTEIDLNKSFKIVKPEVINPIVSGKELIETANEFGLDVQILNDNVKPIIVALIDKQKFEYEQKKAKKEAEKRSKQNVQKLKEIKFHVNIFDNDMNTKIAKAKVFLEKGDKVKLVMILRGRENNMEDFAIEKFKDILSKFENIKIEPIKKFGSTFFTFISK